MEWICEMCEHSKVPTSNLTRVRLMTCPKHGVIYHWPKLTLQPSSCIECHVEINSEAAMAVHVFGHAITRFKAEGLI